MEHCEHCGKSGDENSIRRCSGCKSVRYCSRDCQKRHWLVHRVTCSPSKTVMSDSENDVKPTTAEEQPKPESGPSLKNPGATFDPWENAMSRALEAFPGNRIIDRFTGFVRDKRTDARTNWVDLNQDKEGWKAFMTLKTATSSAPYFRYDDLQRGHFLCLKDAVVKLENCDDLDSHFITVNHASTVRIFSE